MVEDMGKRFSESFGKGHSRHGKKFCRVCFRPVRSGMGEVCARPECHTRYLAVYEKRGW